MAVKISLENMDEFKKNIAELGKAFPGAARRAVARSAEAAKTAAAKEVATAGMPNRVAKEGLQVEQPSDFTAILSASRRRIPLVNFSARGPEPSRGKGSGVSYKLSGGRGRDPNAFIATMPSGHRGVFKRLHKSRNPISESFGPSVWEVIRKKFLGAVTARAYETLTSRLRHEISRLLAARRK